MSTTFTIDGIEEENGYELPCPACGHSLMSAANLSEPPNCSACLGYGGPDDMHMPVPQFVLNVHNGNARKLFDLLQLDPESGQVEAGDLLFRISMVNCPEAHDGHIAKLVKIAEKARKYDRPVVWS